MNAYIKLAPKKLKQAVCQCNAIRVVRVKRIAEGHKVFKLLGKVTLSKLWLSSGQRSKFAGCLAKSHLPRSG